MKTSGCDNPEFHVLSGYRAGYQKALVDLRNVLEQHSDSFSHSKILPKKKNALVQNLITVALEELDEWVRMGGEVDLYFNPTTQKFYINK